jgi:hypothetical protein
VPAHDPTVRVLSSKIAAIERHHPDTDTGELRRDMRAAQLAEYISRVVAEAPPLTEDQRNRIAALLRSGGGQDAA